MFVNGEFGVLIVILIQDKIEKRIVPFFFEHGGESILIGQLVGANVLFVP